MKSSEKITYLDGLRGLAAISVVFSHAFLWFLPALHSGPRAHPDASELELAIFNSPVSFFYKGGAAVWLFFVLSGFVLSYGLLKRRDDLLALRIAATKRYFRLGFPVFFSVMIGYLLMSIGAFKARELGLSDSFMLLYNSPASFIDAMKQGLYGSLIFGKNKYNFVLWTISIELYGSFLVFGVIALFGKNMATIRAICIAVAICSIQSHDRTISSMALFASGMLLATFRINNFSGFFGIASSALLALSGLYLMGYHPGSESYKPIVWIAGKSQMAGAKLNWPEFFPQVGSVLVLYSIFFSSTILQPLSLRPFAWLGKISYSVYLLHSFILSIVAQYVATKYTGWTAAAISLSIVLPATIIASGIFYRYVDAYFTGKVNTFFGSTIIKRESTCPA